MSTAPPQTGLRLVAVNGLLTLILLECALQVVHVYDGSSTLVLARINRRLQVKVSWEEYFLSRYLDGEALVYARIHQPHPTRGWSMKPSTTTTTAPNRTYTTNRQAYRALYDFVDEPAKYQVLVVGDSFTFGDDVDDKNTWPHLLQAAHSELNVFNMAGSGYGIDQMLVTLEEEIARYSPDLVVCAFIDDDLYRSTLAFRDYKKPLFVLRGETLVRTNTPVGSIDEVVDEIGRKPFYSYSPLQTVNLFHNLFGGIVAADESSCSAECRRLNGALLDRMQALARQHHAEFMLTYLPHGEENSRTELRSYGEGFFDAYNKGRRHTSLNPRASFLAADFKKSQGHYKRNENLLLSTKVMETIAALESYGKKSVPPPP